MTNAHPAELFPRRPGRTTPAPPSPRPGTGRTSRPAPPGHETVDSTPGRPGNRFYAPASSARSAACRDLAPLAPAGTSRTATGTTTRPVSAQLSPNPCATSPTASGPRPPASPAALLNVTATELRPGRLPYSRA